MRLSRRIKAVSTERERIRARERERLRSAQTKSTLRAKPSGIVKQLVETLSLSSWLSTETAKTQLAMAGYRGAGAEYVFLAFRLIAPIAFFLIAAVYSIFIVNWDRPFIVKIGARNRRRLRRHQGAGAVSPQHDRQEKQGTWRGRIRTPSTFS